MNSRAYETKLPAVGRCSTSSPSARMTKNAATPQMAYERISPGPSAASLDPEPRKRPTPIAPPIAIILTWRLLRDLAYPSSPSPPSPTGPAGTSGGSKVLDTPLTIQDVGACTAG